MATLLKPDICVIGSGSGALAVAAGAAAFGAPVVLVAKADPGGLSSDIASRSLVAAADRAHAMRSSQAFGISGVEPDVDFRSVQRHVRAARGGLAPNSSVERLSALGVRVVQAEARFIDARTVLAGDHEIRARRFVVATGSSPLIPALPGLGGIEYLTEETIFELARRPGHLIVIGGEARALELAQAYRRLGSNVTFVAAHAALNGADPELTGIALARLRAEGIDIRQHTNVAGIERRGRSGIRLLVERDGSADTIDGTHLLVAAGRMPDIAGLDLERAGIRHDGGAVAVDASLRTSNRRVYAIGNAAAGMPADQDAAHQGSLVLRQLLFRRRERYNPNIVPRVASTRPELAQVGLTEAEARAGRHGRIAILRSPFSENGQAQAERSTEGFVKVIAGGDGRILGAGIVGANAGELINLWALALSKDLRIDDLTAFVPAHPSLSEIGKSAAISYLAASLRRPSLRRMVRFLRRFG